MIPDVSTVQTVSLLSLISLNPFPSSGREAEEEEEVAFWMVPLVFTSPMLRATQTAEILFPGARQIELHALREMAFGKLAGKPLQPLVQDTEFAQ